MKQIKVLGTGCLKCQKLEDAARKAADELGIPYELEKVKDINAIMKKYALEGELVEQIKYSMNNELVSSDIVGTSQPAIYDSNATIVSADGKSVANSVYLGAVTVA